MRNSIKFIFSFIFLFSQITFAQSTGKNIEFNSVTGADYFTNYVVSPSAKKNASNTTTSSATVTQDTTNKIDNVASYSVDTSATSGYVEFTLGTVYDPATSGNCEFKGVFKGDGTLYSAQIVDGSGNLLNSAALTNETAWRAFSIIYPCAASGSRKVRITQTTAGTSPAINVGKLYYGQATGIGSGVPNNVFSAKVSSAGVVSEENEDFISGNAAVTDTSLFTITWNTSKFTAAPTCNVTGRTTFTDGTYDVKIDTQATTSSIAIRTYAANTTNNFIKYATDFNITCTRAGTDFIQPTITPNQFNFGPISYTPTLTGQGSGSATVSGTYTRSGSRATVCVAGTKDATAGTGSATVKLSLPPGIVLDTTRVAATTIGTGYTALNVNNFSVSIDVSDVNNLYFLTGGNILLGSNLNANNTFGNGCITFPVVGWTENQNAPQLVGSVTSNASGAEQIVKASATAVCTTGTCALSASSGDVTVTFNSTGNYAVTFANPFKTAAYTCNISAANGFGGSVLIATMNVTAKTTTSAQIYCVAPSTGTLTNCNFEFICTGPR